MLQQLLLFGMLMLGFLVVAIYFGGEVWRKVYPFQRNRRLAKLRSYDPRAMWRKARKKPIFEVKLTTIRDFVLTLQLSLSLAETLAGAINQAAKQFGERGVFGNRLSTRVRSQLQVEPEKVIRALAEDFQNEHLTELAERLEMAHDGGLSYAEAVNLTLDDVEEDIRMMVEKEIERAPVMLTIPMIIGVFFSALALLGFPLLSLMFRTVGQTGATQ